MRALLLLALQILLASLLSAHVEVLFDKTDQRLEIIAIRGQLPGPTVLVFGGIHGDEPGGYFSAELLAHIHLRRGNLIVAPRVNFPSVLLNRRELYGDMNRKFTPQPDPNDPQRQVVDMLKELMGQADLFINLHDAHGFHRDAYESPRRNPSMYGQALIVDTDRFYSPRLGRELSLVEMGQRILSRVNQQIANLALRFHFWNHNSLQVDTEFPEMRKSATHYAMVNYAIPAFGLETSKDLPTLGMKVHYQLLVVGEILREFGLEFDMPFVDNLHPVLHWIELLKNGRECIRINADTNLRLEEGDRLVIDIVCASDDAGLSADIVGWGMLDDTGREFVFSHDTEIMIRKNNLEIGHVHLRHRRADSLRRVHLTIDGRPVTVSNWGVLETPISGHLIVGACEPPYPALKVEIRAFMGCAPALRSGSMGVQLEELQPELSFRGQGRTYWLRLFSSRRLIGGFQIECGGAPASDQRYVHEQESQGDRNAQ